MPAANNTLGQATKDEIHQLSTSGRYPDYDDKVRTETYSAVDQAAPPEVGRRPRARMSAGTKVALGMGAAVVVLAATGVLGSIGSDEPSTANGPGSTAPPAVSSPPPTSAVAPEVTEAGPAPAGSAVRDGKFEFQVLGVERGATPTGDASSPETATGEFLTVRLRVTNIGVSARSFSATNQKLIIDGEEHDATGAGNGGWLEDIKPGLSGEAQVTFDIPPGAQPQAIELHDSMFSDGALLAL